MFIPKKMLKNLNITNGLIFSQRVMLELTKHGYIKRKSLFHCSKTCTKFMEK